MKMFTSTNRFHEFSIQRTLRRLWAINAPLTLVGVAMLLTLVGAIVGLVLDPQVITGAPAWMKPVKFAISLAIYAFTFVWLLGFVRGHKRLVGLIASVTAIGALIEMAIIAGQVLRGTTSHFNYSTPLDGALYSTMGISIIAVWTMTLLLAILLLTQRMPVPAYAWALRLGLFLTLVGMGVGVLMVLPSAAQHAALTAGQHLSITGAHSVGVADGGPGLPFVGWSTIGGDLRVAHFIGLHALQIMPLLGWLITRHFRRLDKQHQLALVWTTGLSYLVLILLLTWQALRGQSVIAPDAITLGVLSILIATATLILFAIIIHARKRGGSTATPDTTTSFNAVIEIAEPVSVRS